MTPETITHPPQVAAHSSSVLIGKHRIEALADGLFAIVMTLLVLELKVPEIAHRATNAELMHELSSMWRVLFSFTMTFGLASLFWVLQQTILTATRTLNRLGAAIHLCAMMFVVFMPFTTAMLGHYISSGFVMSLYFGNQAMVALLLCIAWLRERHDGNVADISAEAEQKITIRSITMTCALAGASIVAFFNPQYAVFGALPGVIGKRLYRRKMKVGR